MLNSLTRQGLYNSSDKDRTFLLKKSIIIIYVSKEHPNSFVIVIVIYVTSEVTTYLHHSKGKLGQRCEAELYNLISDTKKRKLRVT